MNIGRLVDIKTLEEAGGTHRTRYTTEVRLFSCVQQGDIDALISQLESIQAQVVTGTLSSDTVRQYKYLAVSAVTLATRYAVQGGLNENTAYDFSDRVISRIDALDAPQDILNCLANKIICLTEMVRKSRQSPAQSPHIRKCICYINENIGEKITVARLAELCGLSGDYLSQIFRAEMGEKLSAYITGKKLEAAKELIRLDKKNGEICAELGFSSTSYFITAFKKRFNMTPSEYRNLTRDRTSF